MDMNSHADTRRIHSCKKVKERDRKRRKEITSTETNVFWENQLELEINRHKSSNSKISQPN